MTGLNRIEEWFSAQGWTPFAFQRELWNAFLRGESGLLHSATGTGKTLAAWLGLVASDLDSPAEPDKIQALWITPLRALASDTQIALSLPVEALELGWRVSLRTGDTTTSERQKMIKNPPGGLITTPESLSVMLSQPNHKELFAHLKLIVVDEWHELMSTKRGVQTELCMARLRHVSPGVRTWGLSATLGNLEEAKETLLGPGAVGVTISGEIDKEIIIDSILPETVERFPWAGHFGTTMIPYVIDAIAEGGTCLVFCNTRSQTEIWYQAILEAMPEWAKTIAIHHGSLEREVRDEVEQGLKSGRLRAAICTSSLDLGIDFTPVDRVIQVGSPKGVARLLQRAGRSGHQPGIPSRVICVPTHAMEMVDIAAARQAAVEGKIEAREGIKRPLDLLAQHAVTIALGSGFESESFKAEVRSTAAYEHLSDEEWDWVLLFITQGGQSLKAYPEFRRVVLEDGTYQMHDEKLALRHRMSIGTISSDAAINIQFVGGTRLGSVEESFVSRLTKGDTFVFAGRLLEFVRVKEMTALVKAATVRKGAIPRWMGGRLPLSSELAQSIRERLAEAREGELISEEMARLEPLLEVQQRWSAIPSADQLLIEQVETREGHHLFIYPMEGRIVHEGLAALMAHRLARIRPTTFSLACNDYGMELLSDSAPPLLEALERGDLFSTHNLGEEILASMNQIEMAKRQFRDIARIAGLVFQGYPGQNKTARQIQSSSGLFYDVFSRYDPDNLLLTQARREVLDKQLEASRLASVLRRMASAELVITNPERPTPMAFPILVDRLRDVLTTESITERLKKMSVQLEEAAG